MKRSASPVAIAAVVLATWLVSDAGTLGAPQEPSRPKRQATITDASKVFLSSVIVNKWGPNAENAVVVPQPGKLTGTIYYDQPVALNIPFDVPFQDRPVWICYNIADREDNPVLQPDFASSGLYRSDGRPLADGSVFRDVTWQADSSLQRKGWFHESAPIPTWIDSPPPPAVRMSAVGVETVKPGEFDQTPREMFFFPKILLKPAQPGPYVLWFYVRHWGDRAGWQTELEAPTRTIALRVSLLVAGAERTFEGPDFFKYLFHGGEKPPALDDQLYRAYRLDVDLTLTRNGWIFDHTEAIPVRKDIGETSITQGPLTASIDAKTSAGGPTVSLGLSTTTKDDKGAVVYQDAADWKVAFPASIDDVGVSDVVFTGTESHQAAAGYDAASSYKVVNWEQWLRGTVHGPEHYADGVYMVDETGCPPFSGFAQDGQNLGSPAQVKKWRMGDCRPTRAAPADGKPYIARYFSQAPKRLDDPLTQKIGPQPIIVEQVGFWTVKGFYRRRSEADTPQVSGGERATAAEVVKNEDKFWEWYPGFSEKLEAARDVVETERTMALLLGMNVQNLRRSNRILLAADMTIADGGWMADLFTLGDAPIPGDSDDAFTRRMKMVRAQADELRETLEKIDASTKKAKDALATILAELDRACDAYSGTHPEVLMYRRKYTEMAQRLPLEFAVASGDLDAFKKAVEELSTAAASAQVRVWEAGLLVQRGDAIEALYALRDALSVEPGNLRARAMAAELEASLIGSSLRKAHGAIEDARAAFYKYMKERGFSKDEPKNAWLGQLWSPLRNIDSEMAWSAFTSGASMLAVTLVGADRAGEEQRGLSAYEASMTRAYLGLQTILRLTMRGHTVAEISKMTSAALQQALPLKHATGADYTPQEFAALGAMVQDAIKNLPDVQALASDDRVALQFAVGKNYWDPKDVGNTWAEWIGDLSSPKNLLLMLAPFSVASVGGRVVTVEMWGWRLTAAEQSIMAGEGITRGTEVISTLVGWDRAMKALAGTRQAERLLVLLERMHKFEKGLGVLPRGASATAELVATGQQAAWYGGKFVATMIVQTMAGVAAEHAAQTVAGDRGGEVARFVVEAMMMLSQDHELMAKLLKSGVVEPQKMRRLVHEQYLPVMREAQQRIEQRFALKAELQAIIAARRQGRTLTPKESEALANAYANRLVPEGKPADLIPNGDPIHDSEIATKRVVDEATSGSDPLASQYPASAAEKMEPRVRAKQKDLKDRVDKAEQLERDLVETQPGLPVTAAGTPSVERAEIPDWFRWSSKHPTPLGHKSTIPKVREADAALFDGETDRAIKLYEEVQTEITYGSPESELLEQRLQFARSVLQTPRPPAGAAARELADISEAEAERLFAREQVWRATEPCATGTFSKLYCDGDYIIKEFEVGQNQTLDITPAYLEAFAQGEAVASDLGRALGLDVGAVRVRLVRDAQGNMAKAQFVYRRMGDKSLREVSTEMVFQFRKELAEMDVLANLLNDYDRHAGNYRLVDGRVVGMDFGLADPRGVRARGGGVLGIDPAQDARARSYLYGYRGRDHWFIRMRNELTDVQQAVRGDTVAARAENLHDLLAHESLRFKDAEPMVRKVDALMADETRLRTILKESYRKVHATKAELDHYALGVIQVPGMTIEQQFDGELDKLVEQTIENLRWRHKYLNDVAKGLDERNYLPLGQPKTSPAEATGGEGERLRMAA